MKFLSSVNRKLSDFHLSHVNPPRYLLCDAAVYRAILKEIKGWEAPLDPSLLSPPRLDVILGLRVVVVPIPEMFCVVADPWVELQKADMATNSGGE